MGQPNMRSMVADTAPLLAGFPAPGVEVSSAVVWRERTDCVGVLHPRQRGAHHRAPGLPARHLSRPHPDYPATSLRLEKRLRPANILRHSGKSTVLALLRRPQDEEGRRRRDGEHSITEGKPAGDGIAFFKAWRMYRCIRRDPGGGPPRPRAARPPDPVRDA